MGTVIEFVYAGAQVDIFPYVNWVYLSYVSVKVNDDRLLQVIEPVEVDEHRGFGDDTVWYHNLHPVYDNFKLTSAMRRMPFLQRRPGDPRKIVLFYTLFASKS